MTNRLRPGVYEDMITAALQAEIDARHQRRPVRCERKRDGRGVALPYHCLGRAHYRSHESERPMKVLWELERPMPGWLYQTGKVVAG